MRMSQNVYSGRFKLLGEEHPQTLLAANNYADSLLYLQRFEESKSLMCKTMPVARRVLGDNHEVTLRVKLTYALALYNDTGATLDDLREAVTTLEETARTARRVLGATHPITVKIEHALPDARAALRAREEASSLREAMAAMAPPEKE